MKVTKTSLDRKCGSTYLLVFQHKLQVIEVSFKHIDCVILLYLTTEGKTDLEVLYRSPAHTFKCLVFARANRPGWPLAMDRPLRVSVLTSLQMRLGVLLPLWVTLTFPLLLFLDRVSNCKSSLPGTQGNPSASAPNSMQKL